MLLSEGLKTIKLIKTVGTESIFKVNLINFKEWAILGSPHGGMLICTLVSCMSQLQSKTAHPDIIQLSAVFLSSPKIETLQIKINLLRKGRGFTNLTASLMTLTDKVLLTATAIYSTMPDIPSIHLPPSPQNPTLLPLTPSKYAAISPMLTHPSITNSHAVSAERGRRWSTDSILDWEKLNRMKWLEDDLIKQKRIGNGTETSLKLEWGSWFELNGEKELTMETLPFYSDIFSSIPELLPQKEKVGPTWFPTMSINLQFHAKLPSTSTTYQIAPKTVGIFSSGKWIQDGRHQQDVEIWTAPCFIGDRKSIDKDWRKKSMILITSTQLALCLPAAGFEPKL